MQGSSVTQLRLSLVGGGTDLPEHYQEHGAELLAAGLSLEVHVRARPRSDGLFRVNDAAAHPVNDSPSLVAALLRRVRPQGADLDIRCPVSPGAGLGGSGAVATGVVAALRAVEGLATDATGTVRTAFEVERHDFGSRVGLQDHVTAVFGGLVRLRIEPSGQFHVRQEPELLAALQDMFETGCLLFDTGVRRQAKVLLDALAKDLRRSEGDDQRQAARAKVADCIEQAIRSRDLEAFGNALHEHWVRKRELGAGMSSGLIDEAYAAARNLGALGGKLIGAGGGGFMLLICPRDRREALRVELGSRGMALLDCRPSSGGLRVSAERSA